METHLTPQPFLKWAGGKRQLLPEIIKQMPETFHTYYEPFVGAGAVLFRLEPTQAVVSDINEELINTYCVIRDSLEELLVELGKHQNEREYYYAVRDSDLSPEFGERSPVEKAARIIYLNKTCFNGLFRVNSKGHFNVPFGRYVHPKICDVENLRAVHAYLSEHQVEILHQDFEAVLTQAVEGDFVYLDPPYEPLSETSSFTSYSLKGFNQAEQVRLKKVFDKLTERGVDVLLSNSASPFIVDLYAEYHPLLVSATRTINSKASLRGKIDEVLIKNY
ncbi:MAG: DNA adenine methylase [Desulfitobacteriaceae bacterium]|nr:DNA adenine methylase [Desulfitobacteriaceae bacterium]MDI6915726.1 DNA adenine methylase [Desulfitobacteriaceae bacterium]